jgi:hypothetical protein
MKILAAPHYETDSGEVDLYLERYSPMDRTYLIEDLLEGETVTIPKHYQNKKIQDYLVLDESNIVANPDWIEQQLKDWESSVVGSGELIYNPELHTTFVAEELAT